MTQRTPTSFSSCWAITRPGPTHPPAKPGPRPPTAVLPARASPRRRRFLPAYREVQTVSCNADTEHGRKIMLRVGIILTVTGISAMVVALLPSRPNRTLSRRTGVIVAIVLLVVGIPLLVVGALTR